MSEHRPTVVNDPDQDGEALDADMLPEEFPDDRPLASREYGTTEAEQARGESLNRKLRREEPEPDFDADGGQEEESDDDSPDLLSVEEENGEDHEDQLVTLRGRRDRHNDDSGQPHSMRSAEEDAIHLVDRDTDLDVVTVAALTIDDADEFLAGVEASRDLHRPWVDPPDDLEGFSQLIDRQGERFASFTIRCDEGLVGIVNASEIVRGAFQNAYLGYYAFREFSGRGLMQAGMRMVLSELFDTVGLHRVEANVRPENTRSIRLIERLGFRREGYSPDYLYLDGAWRDHERWALLSTDPL